MYPRFRAPTIKRVLIKFRKAWNSSFCRHLGKRGLIRSKFSPVSLMDVFQMISLLFTIGRLEADTLFSGVIPKKRLGLLLFFPVGGPWASIRAACMLDDCGGLFELCCGFCLVLPGRPCRCSCLLERTTRAHRYFAVTPVTSDLAVVLRSALNGLTTRSDKQIRRCRSTITIRRMPRSS